MTLREFPEGELPLVEIDPEQVKTCLERDHANRLVASLGGSIDLNAPLKVRVDGRNYTAHDPNISGNGTVIIGGVRWETEGYLYFLLVNSSGIKGSWEVRSIALADGDEEDSPEGLVETLVFLFGLNNK